MWCDSSLCMSIADHVVVVLKEDSEFEVHEYCSEHHKSFISGLESAGVEYLTKQQRYGVSGG